MAEKIVKYPSKGKLEGKVAIITGGASGVGEETARLFATQGGARAVVIADIQDDLGQKLSESIGSNVCSYYHCDVTNEEQVEEMVAWTIRTYGQLDIMCSNAGIFSRSDQDILNLDLSDFDRMYSVNARGMATCVKHAARAMKKGHVKGSIICTASVGGSKGADQWTDYIMSKHAVIGLMRCASKQLGEYGIRVNSVSPSTMATPMVMERYKCKTVEEAEKLYQPFTSLKNEALKVKNVADALLFLASDDSSFITGHDLVVDGGYST